MRTFVAFGAMAIVAAPFTAAAEVSADLVFCSKPASPRERIACYDAAARIAARGPSFVSVPAASRDVTPYVEAPVKNPLQGAFVAIGGSYGLSAERQVSLGTGIALGASDLLSTQGWSGRAVAGYNATAGNFLFGAEIAGRFGSEGAKFETTAIAAALPFALGVGMANYQIKNDAGVHIAARAGITFDQTLVFARAGVGASRIVESGSLDTRTLATCSAFGPFGNCLGYQNGTLTTLSNTRWLPSAVFGAGIEQNIGPFFARAEGEIEMTSLRGSNFNTFATAGTVNDVYWTARAMAAVGMRF